MRRVYRFDPEQRRVVEVQRGDLGGSVFAAQSPSPSPEIEFLGMLVEEWPLARYGIPAELLGQPAATLTTNRDQVAIVTADKGDDS